MIAPSASVDRLYELLPAFHRSQDADRGYPLRALLRVINEQVMVVEDDIARLYDDWFIETCADWVVPYICDLVGYKPVHQAGETGDPATVEGRLRNSYLIPRREVANTIAMRRRKGTLSALADLVDDVGGWPGFAVEFYRRLGWTQHLNHLHLRRGRTANLRDANALDLLGGAFDRSARTVDVRRVDSSHRHGRYNIPSVGAFVFRMKSYAVTGTAAYCLEEEGPQCYTFSVLGNDAPLYTNPQPDVTPASELTLPLPIRRPAFQTITHEHPLQAQASTDYYGAGKSVAIYAPDWPKKGATQPIPAEKIVPADLRNWSYTAQRNSVAVDPVSGRILFPAAQLPKQGVSVDYHYGFSADIGGCEYARPMVQPTLEDMSRIQAPDLLDAAGLIARLKLTEDVLSAYLRANFASATIQMIDAYAAPALPSAALVNALLQELNAILSDADLYTSGGFGKLTNLPQEINQIVNPGGKPASPELLSSSTLMRLNRLLLELAFAKIVAIGFALYRVGKNASVRLADALAKWQSDAPRYAIIEFIDSSAYTEPVNIALLPRQTLQLRAADRKRPVLRMLDYMSDKPDAFAISGGAGSRFVLDGLLVSGRGLQINGPDRNEDSGAVAVDLCEVVIRHCTLVPGWGLDCDCVPKRPNEPSIELIQTTTKLVVEHSIIGSIEVTADPTLSDPLTIKISDSIVDATRSGLVALSAPAEQYAFAEISVIRSTLLGTTRAHAVHLAENSIFMGCIHVARRQHGCIRFCYVTPNSRTPKRYHCQPDLVCAAVAAAKPTLTGAQLVTAQAAQANRVRPQLDSTRYGNPAYARLASDCATEITRGADDESEMGVFHDLFHPQRQISLQTRLGEYTPAGIDAGILFAS
jgi:hypothetical protein